MTIHKSSFGVRLSKWISAALILGTLGIVPSAWWMPIDKSQAATSSFTAPQNVTLSANGIVSWSAPVVTTGITAYQVEYSTDGTTYTTAVTGLGPNTTSYAISLTAGNSYYVRVAAMASTTLGPYGYQWKKLYSTVTPTRSGNDIVYESGYGCWLHSRRRQA